MSSRKSSLPVSRRPRSKYRGALSDTVYNLRGSWESREVAVRGFRVTLRQRPKTSRGTVSFHCGYGRERLGGQAGRGIERNTKSKCRGVYVPCHSSDISVTSLRAGRCNCRDTLIYTFYFYEYLYRRLYCERERERDISEAEALGFSWELAIFGKAIYNLAKTRILFFF